MSSPLRFGSLSAPGTLGLVTEDNALETDTRIALKLTNTVYDSQGRVCARKGWEDITTTGGHAAAVEAIFEYHKDATTKIVVSAGGGSLYSGTTTLTDITGALTPSDDHWQFVNFNGKCIGVQAGESPIVWTGSGNAAAVVAGSGSAPTGNCALSAWGRLWATSSDERTVQFSGLLDETDWGGAGAGSLDTAEVWPDGLDQIVALAEWQDRLVIFGQRSLLVYSGPEDPTAATFVLDDVVRVGCVARDSVEVVGNDLVWLSVDGLRGLRRAIEYTNLPQYDLVPEVRSALTEDIVEVAGSPEAIHCVYSRAEGFLTCRIGSRYWSFDMRQSKPRASKWTGSSWQSAVSLTDGDLLFGQTGVIGQYAGYSDDGSPYEFAFRSAFLDLTGGREVYPKTARAIVSSTGGYTLTCSTSYDYAPDEITTQGYLDTARTVAEWQPADVAATAAHEWGTAEWSGGPSLVGIVPFDLSGAGSLIQIGISAIIDGYALCLQRIDVTMRIGRIAA